jgi:hypothetical protein
LKLVLDLPSSIARYGISEAGAHERDGTKGGTKSGQPVNRLEEDRVDLEGRGARLAQAA